MDPSRWKAVNRLFHEALEVAPAERHCFVVSTTEGDPELRAEVELLLQADANAGSYFEHPLVDPGLSDDLAPSLAPDDVLCGRFRILRHIAEGGMGHVYEAYDSELEVQVALKTIRPEIVTDPEASARFRQEVRLARRITHPNVCRTFDLERETSIDSRSGASREFVFLTMEFLEGETLAARIERTGALPLDEALGFARQIANALQAAHSLGIIHRDMKPANVMLIPEAGSEANGFRAVITDFGLARPDPLVSTGNSSVLSHSARPIGTLAYMAPEQLQGEQVSAATDLYAFGLILFEMVTGQRAFPSDNFLKGIAQRLTGSLPDPQVLVPSLPVAWRQAIEGCLRIEPEERFKTTADAVAVLTGGKARRWPRRSSRTAVAAGVLATLAGGAIYYHLHQARHLNARDTVVVADFANSTGESVFKDTLKTALTISLNQSPFLNVVSENKLSDTLQLMNRADDANMTPELWREICLRAGSKAYITGSIAELGSEYVLGLRAVNCENGALVANELVTADGKEKVLDALGTAVSRIRGELGESLGSVQKFDVPLAEATTPSLSALEQLSLGRKVLRQNPKEAELYYLEAIRLDPNFAMAYHDLGRLYFSLDEVEKGRAGYTKAFELRSRTSQREKLEITATYYESATGELEKAVSFRNEQTDSYPRDAASHEGLGYVYSLLGKYELAIDEYDRAIQLDPADPAPYGLLANSLLALQRLDDAGKAIARADHPNAFLLHNASYGLNFLIKNRSALEKDEEWMLSSPPYRNFGYSLASDTEAYAGHLREAHYLTNSAVEAAKLSDSGDTGSVWYENEALREAGAGNFGAAKAAAAKGLLEKPVGMGAEVEAALAYAMVGDNAKAESTAGAVGKSLPLDTQVQALWLPAIRAQLVLNGGQPQSAIDELRKSVPIEFGDMPFVTNASCLYPTYIRGEAYLKLGQGDLAAAEFQKIIDHSGLVWNCWTGALAHLGLARANAESASTTQGAQAGAARDRALSAYNDFFALWKNADIDIPVLKQAKSDYARLAGHVAR